MPTDTAMSKGRRLAGSAALIATAAGLGVFAVHDIRWIEWGLLACAGVVGAAGVGLGQRSLPLQILSRATAWAVLTPTLLVTMISTLSGGQVEWGAAALALGSGASLVLARPMLDTASARADFAPTSFRRWLLSAATAAACAGLVTGLFGLDELHWHTSSAIGLLVLSLSLLASAIGVVRMRAWGILLGGLTAVSTLVASAVMHDAPGLVLLLATIPGFMFLLPVLLAKHARTKANAQSFTRVAAYASGSDMPARVRVSTDAADPFADELERDDEAALAPRAAARARA
jgi:hypothetical protein